MSKINCNNARTVQHEGIICLEAPLIIGLMEHGALYDDGFSLDLRLARRNIVRPSSTGFLHKRSRLELETVFTRKQNV